MAHKSEFIAVGTNLGIQSENTGLTRNAPVIGVAAQQALTDAGAVSLNTYNTTLTTTGVAAVTLANSTFKGQLKRIQMISDLGDATLTPTTLTGGTTITFADVGDTAELVWDGSSWVPVALYNVADGATAPVLA